MKKKTALMLDSDILREISVAAEESGKSVSEFIEGQFAQVIGRRRGYKRAKKRALLRLRNGMNLGWTPQAARDDLHER